ncbi:MAG: hypothetical protein ABIJ61_12960 [bacterium]
MNRIDGFVLALLWLLFLISTPCLAERQFAPEGAGLRAGLVVDPDQLHVGAHVHVGDIAPGLMFVPNVELGFGSDLLVVATSAELDYRFPTVIGAWHPYVGLGAGPVFVSTKYDDDTGVGLSLQVGLIHKSTGRGGFPFLEFKLGLEDYPDIKLTIGWTFGS